MNEVKKPKKPLIFYYAIVLLILLFFNFLGMPLIAEHSVQEVNYNTFVEMAANGEIGSVEIQAQENRILFTNKDGTAIYKTGMVDDPELTQRLLDSGAQFNGEIIEQASPFLTILLTWVLPILVFIWLGQYMSKKLMEKAGGPNSLAFGMGKSNAKVYVKSSEGIKFSDVAGEDEAKEALAEVVDYRITPGNTARSARRCRRVSCSSALRGQARPCWPRPSQARQTCRSFRCLALSLWRCLWAWAPPKCATSLNRPRQKHRASCS